MENSNEEEIRKMFQFLDHERQTEIRLIHPKGELKPFSLFVSNEEEFVKTCEEYNGHYNVYVGIHERKNNGTTAKDVVSVKSIVIDVDSVRQTNSKEAATEEELKKAEEVADKIINYLAEQGFRPAKIMSGNGYHIYLAIPKIELNDENRFQIEAQIKTFIDFLKSMFETGCAKIDQIGDLPRIIKVCGTQSIKGQNTQERPHRVSFSCGEFVRNEDSKLWDWILNLKPIFQSDFTRKVEAEYWDILKKHGATEQERCSCVMQIHHAHKTWTLEEAFDFIARKNEWENFDPNQTFLKMQGIWERYTDEIKEINDERQLKEIVLELLRNQKPEATEKMARFFEKKFYVHTIRDDKFSEIWVYYDGIYVPQGKTYIREFCRKILGKAFTRQLANTVIDKVESDTFIEAKEFFSKENIEEIAVQNGILNIKTKKLIPFTPEKIFFNKIPVKYVPGKSCPKIKKFFQEVLDGDEDAVKAMEEMFGYLIFKNYSIPKAMMFLGDGRNGKSVTLELMKRFIGPENCSAIPLQQFEKDNFSQIELHTKLANLSGDLDSTVITKSGAFKQLTGKDIISASRKFLPRLDFVNYAKLIFATNRLPRTRDTSLAFFNRWIIFNFPLTFLSEREYDSLSEKERTKVRLRDTNIIDKLTHPDEMSGLLNEALDGLERLLKKKDFTKSYSVKDIERIWISKSDSFRAFARENIVEDGAAKISKKDLRKAYVDYCRKHKMYILSDKAMKEALLEDFSAVDGNMDDGFGGPSCWDGIKLVKKAIELKVHT